MIIRGGSESSGSNSSSETYNDQCHNVATNTLYNILLEWNVYVLEGFVPNTPIFHYFIIASNQSI